MLLDLNPVRRGRDVNARSFAGLMELYEQNYLRLRNLAPDLKVADEMISSVPGHQDLYLSITQRCRYTTMLRLTYRFEDEGEVLFEPDLHLKVYHDACVIEVQQFTSRSHGPLYIADLIEQKWMMNRFLYKWLGYCLHQGHYFQPMQHLKVGNR
ncbi:MAG: DUF1249 domain-containing protein [Gammaproteobacteria bacterium]|nr:MAG: DUF1249 domain-containing protein [Gammaproteobacteria bacterium]